ncbi:helix-turn-helix transcriptional regulator [Streptomyces sp. NRRL B-1347]|uniref:helix-turn-helix transcriptional regulator n=1 Tax=Streptomyces sp. NRRL B-1347 TaxID=1476877 RepID=UPI0004CC8AC3|nr:LuxR family transcriptional regulator [Streptomyces sp. NRRL B-1347]
MPETYEDVLIGRQDDLRRLDALLRAARESRGGALVLRGEPGIGKSALLRQSAESATGFLVLRASGAEFEMELPFAALHQLLGPVTGHLEALPAPHRKALEVAFGLDTGTPDPFLVGVASLGLLVETVRERPLLCVVDDAQWLDRASAKALAFLARRVSAESIALVFAVREPSPLPEFGGLPGHALRGLGAADARALLAAAVRAPLDEHVRARILAEARGNPLALVELPRTAGLAGMAGGFAEPDSIPGVIEQSFRARLALLPSAARLLVTVAAADPIGDPELLWRAAEHLGIDAAAAAESVPLVEFGARIRFSHPLARSAAYRAAAPEERRRAHGALAAATDPVTDPDRRAWHRAQAGAGPDEQVAAELEASATRAQERGGVAAAAAFLERSAALTISPVRRAERTLAAVRAKLSVGDFDAAADLLATVRTDDPGRAARADLLRGRLSFARRRGDEGPTAHLLRAAARLAATDPAWSRECSLDAVEMGLLLGGFEEVVEAVRETETRGDPVSGAAESGTAAPGTTDSGTAAPGTTAPETAAPETAALGKVAPGSPPSGTPAVLTGLISLVSDGHLTAGDILRPVVGDPGHEVWARRPSLGFMLATELWHFESLHGIAARAVTAGRESGSFHALPIALAMRATAAVHRGAFGAAAELISEEEAIADATGAAPLVYPRLHLAALRGRREEAVALFASVDHRMSLSVQWATAVLSNGLADYPAALKAARQAFEYGAIGTAGLALPELVEAAVRCGEPETAAAAHAALRQRTQAGRQAWGLGVEAYARALVTGDESAYQEAIDLLDDSSLVVYRARAQLLYGEWLRRQGRRRDARSALRLAHGTLSDLGMEAFAERAAGELRATGEQARSRTAQATDQLTMQEVHIARLVADGATSKEVAAKLFLSPRTVDAHLRNIFRKLGLTSRRQLRDLPGIRQGLSGGQA